MRNCFFLGLYVHFFTHYTICHWYVLCFMIIMKYNLKWTDFPLEGY